MVGIDRPMYPMDNWSLPFSLVELRNEKNIFVAEFEDQFTSTNPLPTEWLNVDIERSSHRRNPNLGPAAADTHPGDGDGVNFAEKLNSLVRAQVAADVDGHKRAPTLHVSAGRVERLTLATQLVPIVKLEITADSERKMERLDSSVWCLCIQVLQARHLARKEDIFAERRPKWICSYDFFGEVVCVKGELSGDDYDEGVIDFGHTSKHLFKGSIDAVEAMFQNHCPLKFEMETVQVPPLRRETMAQQHGTTSFAGKSLLLDLPLETISPGDWKKLNATKTAEEKRAMTGHLALDLQEERFVDMTVQLHPSFTPHHGRDIGAPLYPPYLNINLKFFRMGPHDDTINPEQWLPPQTRLGSVISKCVMRVVPIEFGAQRHHH
jgi:hypothetical protein